METTVAVMLDRSGQVQIIYADAEECRREVCRLNDDPFVEPGVPDEHAPYTVEVWTVQS